MGKKFLDYLIEVKGPNSPARLFYYIGILIFLIVILFLEFYKIALILFLFTVFFTLIFFFIWYKKEKREAEEVKIFLLKQYQDAIDLSKQKGSKAKAKIIAKTRTILKTQKGEYMKFNRRNMMIMKLILDILILVHQVEVVLKNVLLLLKN